MVKLDPRSLSKLSTPDIGAVLDAAEREVDEAVGNPIDPTRVNRWARRRRARIEEVRQHFFPEVSGEK